MGIPIDKAELLALFLENIVYGIFLTCYLILVFVSLDEEDTSVVRQRFVFPVATLMLVLATAHLILDFIRAVEAFVTGTRTHLPSPIIYYGVIGNPFHVAKTFVYGLQIILGDSVLVWRCYVIYNKSRYVLIPAVAILLVNLAIACVVAWQISVALPGRSIFQTGEHWITAFFLITMCINVCCTGANIGKIWLTRRHPAGAPSLNLFPVITVIVESGAIYTAGVLGLLVAYLSGSNGQYAALDLITPLIGVMFCLIILQIHFHHKLCSSSGATTGWSIPQFCIPDDQRNETTTIPDSRLPVISPTVRGSSKSCGPRRRFESWHHQLSNITELSETRTQQEARPKMAGFDYTGAGY